MELNIDITAQENVQKWLNGNYDEDTKAAIRKMMEENQNELNESFYRNLEFGVWYRRFAWYNGCWYKSYE